MFVIDPFCTYESILFGLSFLHRSSYFLSPPRSLFFKQEMELSLIGLQNAGKTSLVNVIAVSEYLF